jgi:hypothetical protein
MSAPSLRQAVVGDAADIHALMLKLAADIPLAVETLDQEEALYAALRKILAFGQSWAAVDRDAIVGCVLVDAAEAGRHWAENELLNIRYAVGEVLDALLAKILERRVPITATVRDANRTGLAEHLAKMGFSLAENRVGEQRFRHEP